MQQDNSEVSFSELLDTAAGKSWRKDFVISAKLASGINKGSMWADDLLVFYPIFKYLEENVPEDLLPKEFHRKEAFETDLKFQLGSMYVLCTPMEEVKSYVAHLKEINKNEPIMLLIYVYHLYMPLLSVGERLEDNRKYIRKAKSQSFDAIVHGSRIIKFDESIDDLKNKLRKIVDAKALEFDYEMKKRLINESYTVFVLNTEIVDKVLGRNIFTWRKFLIIFVILFMMCLPYIYLQLYDFFMDE